MRGDEAGERPGVEPDDGPGDGPPAAGPAAGLEWGGIEEVIGEGAPGGSRREILPRGGRG
jgi:hypothetical protein